MEFQINRNQSSQLVTIYVFVVIGRFPAMCIEYLKNIYENTCVVEKRYF